MKDPRLVRELVAEKVPLQNLLESTGNHLAQTIKPQQISCPFHGVDTSRSARFYPDTNSMYCFACKKSWDPISFWMKHQGIGFMEAARQLSSQFGVDLSKIADVKAFKLDQFEKSKKGVDKRKMALYLLESRVRLAKFAEDPDTYAKILYVFLSSRHIEDQDKFVEVTMPLARRLSASLD